jgi:DNA-binding transcriptional ArsR family regulator
MKMRISTHLFGALADPTRRAILHRLRAGEASAGDLARPFAMSQPAISAISRRCRARGL